MSAQNLPGLVLDRAHPLARGLVGWWPLNEGAGRRAADVTGNMPGLLVNDPARTGSRNGNAVLFDGSNDYVNIPHDPRQQFSTTLTFCAWVCPTSGTSYPPLLSKTNGAADGYSWEFNNGAPETSIALWHYTGGWGAKGYSTIPNAVWSFVAAVMDGVTEKFYLNGYQLNSYANTDTISASTVALQICGSTSLSRYGGGSVSHMRVYNRALSAMDIREIYANPLAGALAPSRLTRLYTVPVASPPAAATSPLSSDRLYNRSLSRIFRRGETG